MSANNVPPVELHRPTHRRTFCAAMAAAMAMPSLTTGAQPFPAVLPPATFSQILAGDAATAIKALAQLRAGWRDGYAGKFLRALRSRLCAFVFLYAH